MMKIFLTVFLFAWAQILPASDAIVVELETQSRLLPLYLEPIVDEQSGFSKEYLKELDKILSFDFNHNGATYTAKLSPLQRFKHFEDLGDPSFWRSKNVYFVLKLQVTNKELSARLLTVLTATGASIDRLKLSGDLSQDRRVIHKLSDSIHKSLFGEDGIASTRILYTRKIENFQKPNEATSLVWQCDYDGGNARQIVPDDAGYCVTPRLVPPKEGMASGGFIYVSYKLGPPKIYMAPLSTGIGKRYSRLKGNQLMPAISWQRDQVAFISDITGNPDLFIQPFSPEKGIQQQPRQIFATHRATQGSPSFSPDGTKIAFVSNKDGSPKIYTMDIPPVGMRLGDIRANLLSKFSKESTAPSWSPDGSKIAYCALTNGVRQIWMYDFDKNEEKQLTEGSVHKENPCFAANSLHIIFNTTPAKANSELYLMNINQPGAVKISSGPGSKRFPSW